MPAQLVAAGIAVRPDALPESFDFRDELIAAQCFEVGVHFLIETPGPEAFLQKPPQQLLAGLFVTFRGRRV